jgi:hypothetical protein
MTGVSDYRLNDQGSMSGRGTGFFSSLCVQTSSEVHQGSYPIGTGVYFPGVMRGRGVTLTTNPLSNFFFFFFFHWLHGPLGLALASLFRVS